MKIRKGTKKDLVKTENLVKNTYETCNFKEGTKKAVQRYLDWHDPKKNLEHIEKTYRKGKIFYVAQEGTKIIGMVKGNMNKLGNLYVNPKHHRKGIAKKLYEKFEKEAIKLGSNEIKISSSLYAVPFYQKMGYKKTTGIRSMKGLRYQPMKKVLK